MRSHRCRGLRKCVNPCRKRMPANGKGPTEKADVRLSLYQEHRCVGPALAKIWLFFLDKGTARRLSPWLLWAREILDGELETLRGPVVYSTCTHGFVI